MSFIGFRGPLNLYNNMHDGNTGIKKAEKYQ